MCVNQHCYVVVLFEATMPFHEQLVLGIVTKLATSGESSTHGHVGFSQRMIFFVRKSILFMVILRMKRVGCVF